MILNKNLIQNLTLSNKGLKTPAGALAVNILNTHIAIKIEFHLFFYSFKTFSKTEPFHLVVELPDVFPVRG